MSSQTLVVHFSEKRDRRSVGFLLVGLVVVGIALDIIFPPSSGLPPALTSFKTLIVRQFAPAPEKTH